MKRFILVLLIAFLTLAQPAWSDCGTLSAKEKILASDIVFQGRRQSTDGHSTLFSIQKLYKGVLISDIQSVSLKDQTVFKPDTNFIIFAKRDADSYIPTPCVNAIDVNSFQNDQYNSDDALVYADLEVYKDTTDSMSSFLQQGKARPSQSLGKKQPLIELTDLMEEYGDVERAIQEHESNQKWHKYPAVKAEYTRLLLISGRLDQAEKIFELNARRYGQPLNIDISSKDGILTFKTNDPNIPTTLGNLSFSNMRIILDLRNVAIEVVNFSGSNLENSQFLNVSFKHTDFTGSSLKNIQWQDVNYSYAMKWPDNFSPADHGIIEIKR